MPFVHSVHALVVGQATPDDAQQVTTREAVDVLLARPVVALGVVLLTWIVTRIARGLLRRGVRRVAARSVSHPNSFWRVRVQRVFGETPELAEKRRRQRIDAISRMAGHLFSLIAWVVAFIVVLHVMQADLVPVLTSAGFIGAGLAIGGQHAVKDLIAGVGILVEDRFGVGDRIVIETPTGREVDGVVEYVGAFSTRLSSGDSTFHFSNGKLEHVRNLSQNPVTTAIQVPLPDDAHTCDHERVADAVSFAVSQAAGDRSLTGMVLVDDVRAAVRTSADGEPHLAVEVRTAQPLTGTQADRLHRVAARAYERMPVVASGTPAGGRARPGHRPRPSNADDDRS
ncbi:MAG: mechanosensitive ion channel [Actinobacteria bacterium]|nr:mechanosensitive ion channel [Actinomycetota bacterium]